MKNTEPNNESTNEEPYKICPICKEKVSGSECYCSYCGFKFEIVQDETDVSSKEFVQEKNRKDHKTILSKKIIIRILLMLIVTTDFVLAVWGVERIKELHKTEIIVNTSDLELEVGEKKELLIDIKNPPSEYIITYDDNTAVLEKWMDWREGNVRIPLSLIGLKETKDKLNIYIYDKAEYLKKEQEKAILAEKSVPITVKRKSDISLRTEEVMSLSVGKGSVAMVTIEGELPDDFFLNATVPNSIEATWGEWVDDYHCLITLTGLIKTSDEVVISLFDTSEYYDGICLCSVKIMTNVQ